MSTQLSLVSAVTEAAPTPQPPQEVIHDPEDSCNKHDCYNQTTGICPRYGYKIDSELAKRQRLCDIPDEPKKPKHARVNRA